MEFSLQNKKIQLFKLIQSVSIDSDNLNDEITNRIVRDLSDCIRLTKQILDEDLSKTIDEYKAQNDSKGIGLERIYKALHTDIFRFTGQLARTLVGTYDDELEALHIVLHSIVYEKFGFQEPDDDDLEIYTNGVSNIFTYENLIITKENDEVLDGCDIFLYSNGYVIAELAHENANFKNEICYKMLFDIYASDWVLQRIEFVKKQYSTLVESKPQTNETDNKQPLARHWALFFAYLNPSVIDIKPSIEQFCKDHNVNVTAQNVRQQYYDREYNNHKKRAIRDNVNDIRFVIETFLQYYPKEKQTAQNEINNFI